MKNIIFIHCGNLITDKFGRQNTSRCQEIIDEIGSYIKSSGIIDEVEAINVEVVGEPNIYLNLPKVNVNFNGHDVHRWEFPTLDKIIDFARNNPNYNILYLHTKGSSISSIDVNASYSDDVRNYHLYWTLTKFKTCLDALNTNDVVGAELQLFPVRHYSHNMWWVRASHINKLSHPLQYPLIYDERHQAEFWIGRDDTARYHSVCNLYDIHTNAISYEKHLYIRE